MPLNRRDIIQLASLIEERRDALREEIRREVARGRDESYAAVAGTTHDAGDAVLQAVAARSRGCLRETDTVARIGGDEFALILPGADEAQAAAVLGKVVAANAAPVPFEGHAIASGVSIGACSYPRGGSDDEELRGRADLAMYQAKQPGGNRLVFFRPA